MNQIPEYGGFAHRYRGGDESDGDREANHTIDVGPTSTIADDVQRWHGSSVAVIVGCPPR